MAFGEAQSAIGGVEIDLLSGNEERTWRDAYEEGRKETQPTVSPDAEKRGAGEYAEVTTNPRNPLRVRLRQNSVDRWRPHAPLRVYHSPDDEEVPYEDALASVERLRSRGANVTVEPLPGFDHNNSWIQAMPRAVTWFRSLD